MSRIRSLFLGTPEIARFMLEAMIKDPHFEIVGVVSQPDRPAGRKLKLQPSPVKALAELVGLPVLTPESVNSDDVLAQIAAFKAEVVVVVAFGQILKQKFLDLFPKKVVNVHASLLPRWRGAAPIQRALMAGDHESGVCLQVMVKKLDAGPVLGSRKIKLSAEMNAFDLYDQCQTLGAQLLSVDLMDYLRGNLIPVTQDESLVTYAAKIDKAESEVDWNWSAERIHNLVRGMAMGPVAQTYREAKVVKLHRTRVNHQVFDPSLKPGQVVSSSDKSLLVQCGQGSLEILEIQPESRAKMPIEFYLRGYSVKVGDCFANSSEEKTISHRA